MISIDIEALVKEEYNKLNNAKSNYQKLNYINNIIIYRTEFNYFTLAELYSDVRKFVDYYFDSIYEIQGDYYELNENKFISIMTLLPTQERLRLYEYASRLTKKGAFDDYNDWINNELNKVKLKNYINNFKLFNILNLIACISSYNLLAICMTFSIIFLSVFFIFLPSYSNIFNFFNIKYDTYSNNFYINHLANLLTYVFQTENDFKITPLNVYGVITLILIKVVSIGLLFNYLIKELMKKI